MTATHRIHRNLSEPPSPQAAISLSLSRSSRTLSLRHHKPKASPKNMKACHPSLALSSDRHRQGGGTTSMSCSPRDSQSRSLLDAVDRNLSSGRSGHLRVCKSPTHRQQRGAKQETSIYPLPLQPPHDMALPTQGKLRYDRLANNLQPKSTPPATISCEGAPNHSW